MFHARSYCRSALRLAVRAVAAGVLGLVLTTVAAASTIDLSLNVFYTDPANAASGGTWQLVGKSQPGGDFGIAGLSVRLTNINSTVQFHGPRGTVNGSQNAGFWIQTNAVQSGAPNTRNLTIGQAELFNLPPGSDQSLFYGVGTLTNGAPNYPGKPASQNSIGPAFNSLTNLQNIPWAPVPPGDAFGNTAWERAVRFASGTFAAGVTPSFFTGQPSTGQVFVTLPPNNSIAGEIAPASLTTTVRTNFTVAPTFPDYNGNGVVDAADYVLWRKMNINGQQGYDDWKAAFGATGSGAAAASSSAVVPEPASATLVALVALAALTRRRR